MKNGYILLNTNQTYNMEKQDPIKTHLAELIINMLSGHNFSYCNTTSCSCGTGNFIPSDIRTFRKPWCCELYHPRHISKATREKWTTLINLNMASLEECTSFDELYNKVYLLANEIKGIGILATYDTSLAIAISINKPSVMPQMVYLQAGAAEGAKKLGIRGRKIEKEIFVKICPEFEKLSPAMIEHFLCCYKDTILTD